jgi:hypothetical protein
MTHRIHGLGPDPYSDAHPRGAFNRAMRDNARLAHRLHEAQPTGPDNPAEPAAAAAVPLGEATIEQLSDAIAEAIARRQHEPTPADERRLKAAQLLQLIRERDARHIQRARGAQDGE